MNCPSLTQVKLPDRVGVFSIFRFAFSTSTPKELHLCIPNQNMTLNANSMGSTAFSGRTVTLYCNSENANAIKNALEIASVTVEDDVKEPIEFPGGSVQTGLSLFNLPF